MKLYWLDLETTGLDPTKCEILEVAIAAADIEKPFSFLAPEQFVINYEPSLDLDPFIVDMHTKNGLLHECSKSAFDFVDIEQKLLKLVPWIADKDERPVLAGSTVHFDHGFLRVHMPELAKRFSHRHYDVSAIKLFCMSLGMPKPPKAEAHRAVADIMESASHAQMCAEWLSNWKGYG